MKLNETQIKKIIRKVISEGAFTQLKRSPVLNITDDQVLAWYFYDVSVHLENDYDVEHFDGTKIPDFIKPYMDEIVDGIDFEKLNDSLWETIYNHIWDAPELEDMLEKLRNELESQGKAWD